MPRVGSYRATLLVDGRGLKEYLPPQDDEDDDSSEPASTVVRYIEATPGAEFSFQIDLDPNTPFSTGSKRVQIDLDGTTVHEPLFSQKSKRHRKKSQVFKCSGKKCQEAGNWVLKPYQFNTLTTSEDARSTTELMELAKKIGTIKITITDIVILGKSTSGMDARAEAKSVPEKALKGKPTDMSASLGKGKPTAPIKYKSSRRVGEPKAVFVFKYRSRRALQLLDIVPTTPEPQPLQERDASTLSLEEARRLVEQYRQQESQTARIKAEAGEKVKTEIDVDQESNHRKRPATFEDDGDCQIVEVKKCKTTSNAPVEILDLS